MTSALQHYTRVRATHTDELKKNLCGKRNTTPQAKRTRSATICIIQRVVDKSVHSLIVGV